MKKYLPALIAGALSLTIGSVANACTGARLIADDGAVVYGRTLEWDSFDLKSRVSITPRGHQFTGTTPEGLNGKQWQGKYGYVSLDTLEKDIYVDGMNEKGLAVGLYYHPDFAKYMDYQPEQAAGTITATDLIPYLLSQFETVDEVKAAMEELQIVAVVQPELGIPVPAHWMVTEPSGKAIAIEILDGEVRIFENPLGIITNAPNFDWHMTNLRNYIQVSGNAHPAKKAEGLEFSALGGGSGMLGLPGDQTPVSRFVRLAAWTQTARDMESTEDATYELFRILDNYNVPLGSAEGTGTVARALEDGMRSATLWTSAWDLENKTLSYHTQYNRRVRTLNFDAIDFSDTVGGIKKIQMDIEKKQDVEDISNRL
ncbi:linear amide C-N hydrolase [Photobacterium rosenbergii]|uniref:Choloylglycine hydrolase n=2 Tax=Photobacterium rosenbergii TaxID=294936 RepID=A0A2T3N9I6_9GAMM|nr:linear amide C-N hydrolase [Photobacterium rosenbergii]PSW10094.1 choloylglycine hydrolase [Photobacterium rosenbergii]